jgi:dephospho-CoA kinase
MFIVGLTGGIASGKSAVADLFSAHGIAVVDTDLVAREVVEPGATGLEAVVKAFGKSVLNTDGVLNRAALRALVFANPEHKAQLDQLLHPLIRKRTVELMMAAAGTAPYLMVVVPLLIETGFDELVHRVLVVDCPEEMQRARLQARDAASAADAAKIMAAQANRATRLEHADDVLMNAGTLHELSVAVAALHAGYLAQADSHKP